LAFRAPVTVPEGFVAAVSGNPPPLFCAAADHIVFYCKSPDVSHSLPSLENLGLTFLIGIMSE
jgi:hypothetical protein